MLLPSAGFGENTAPKVSGGMIRELRLCWRIESRKLVDSIGSNFFIEGGEGVVPGQGLECTGAKACAQQRDKQDAHFYFPF